MLCQLAFWLMAAIDGHCEELLAILHRDGHVMTPLLTSLGMAHHRNRSGKIPIQKAKLRWHCAANVHRELDTIKLRHWRYGRSFRIEGRVRIDADLIERVPTALTSVGITAARHSGCALACNLHECGGSAITS